MWRVTAHFIFAMHGRRIPKIGSHYDPFGPTKAEPVKMIAVSIRIGFPLARELNF